MAYRVGIPRAMGYYYFYPFFRTLLRQLGAEPVLSPPTSPRLLERMDSCPTDEPCLAVKLHFTHADALAGRKDIDFLLLPIITRVDNVHCCPKFIGITDMTRHGLRLPDDRVLAPVIDYTEDDRQMLDALLPLAERLGVRDPQVLRHAIPAARDAQRRYRALCVEHRLTTPEAYRCLEDDTSNNPPRPALGEGVGGEGKTAVIGHPYILYETVSHQMIDRLREYGPVLTAEMVDPADCAREMETIPEGDRMWPFESMLLGGALHLLRSRSVERIILVGSFECGPESIIESYIEEEAHRHGIPFMVLALDEHSGEAGLVTRLESFMDTGGTAHAHHAPALPTPHIATREEMVVGFPSMGYLDIAVRTFLESLGVRTVPTPRATKTCIALGQEVAPEFACFPFTATLGQLRYVLDHGANTLIMVGGKGFCRLGWYAQIQERLLRGLGYDFQLLVVDSPFPLREKWGPFRDVVKAATGQAPWPRILGAVHLAYRQLAALDRADTLAHRLRAFERDQGTTDAILDRYVRRMTRAQDHGTMRKLEREFLDETAAIETEETNPVRVRIAGEIWVVLEQSATMNIERWLGARERPRVWVLREHSSSNWFRNNVAKRGPVYRRHHHIIEAARPWLTQKVGGDGQMTVGQMALARHEDIDGVLHIFPFTCMPEIIAQNILVRMAEEFDLPVLTYIVSEQTGEAGMETRLEAFLDVLEERKFARQAVHAVLQPG